MQELQQIRTLIGGETHYWVGAMDIGNNGTYYWTGTNDELAVTSALWAPGYPIVGYQRNCVYVRYLSDGDKLHNSQCSNGNHYVCEIGS